jgi:hypothetical protein
LAGRLGRELLGPVSDARLDGGENGGRKYWLKTVPIRGHKRRVESGIRTED